MSLTRLQRVEPEALTTYRVDQIIALAGDGKLRDGSKCSSEFREYLQTQTASSLRRYVSETLSQPFADSGLALQDLVNEIGRRLGFSVTDGRYRGAVNRSGQDGLWRSSEMNLVVEVKTTDAYRINLTTVATYAEALRPSLENSNAPLGLLYVVGRQDTGDLEAQIRGSRYAWDVRLISAEALLDLADLVEVAVDEETAIALRSALLPVEYTRVDYLVNLLTKLAFDVERSVQVDQSINEESATNQGLAQTGEVSGQHNSANTLSPDEFRELILKSLQKDLKQHLTKITKSRYENASKEAYIISVSKRYLRTDQNYWYAFQEKWVDLLRKNGSFLCLGMLDKNFFLQIPGEKAVELIDFLNMTSKLNSRYWHLGLTEQSNKILLTLPKAAKLVDLTEFKVDL